MESRESPGAAQRVAGLIVAMPRRGARRDANEPDIVAALREAGAFVWLLDQPMDLLVWSPWQERLVLLEVKDPGAEKRRGEYRLKASQKEALKVAPCAAFVVDTVERALYYAGEPETVAAVNTRIILELAGEEQS